MFRRILALLPFFALFAVAMLALAAPALAADPTVTAGPIVALVRPYVEALVSGATWALLGWVSFIVHRYIGLRVDASHREALHSAAMTGVRQALARLQSAADATTLQGRTAVLASAVSWMRGSVPGAIAHFGLTPDKLETLAASKLGDLLTPGAVLAMGEPLLSEARAGSTSFVDLRAPSVTAKR